MKRNYQYLIWQDAIYENESDWQDAFEEYKTDGGEPYQNANIADFIEAETSICFDCERDNLSAVKSSNGIIAIASLGLWYGRRLAYGKSDLQSAATCLENAGEGYKRFYVENGDLKACCSHHDGTNFITFREWRNDVSEYQKQLLKNALYDNDETLAQKLIKRLTRGLGRRIAAVYGW